MQPPILFFGALRRLVATIVLPIIVLIYFSSGVLVLEVFSFSDYFRRQAFTIIYLGLRNPYRPTMKEWLWSIPANVLYNITWPAIQIWSFATVFNDSWGTTMRSRKEISRLPSLRTKVWDLGFFCIWIGLVGGAAGRYAATNLMPDATYQAACVVLGTVPMGLLFGLWMIVAD